MEADKSNYQRIGISSNAKAGNQFEHMAKEYLNQVFKTDLKSNYALPIGISTIKKQHKFDLGNDSFLIECKSHRWTAGDNIPSAKLTVWTEAMYYFNLAPYQYKKVLFVERHLSKKRNKTLGEYYFQTHQHLIPESVEIWEFDVQNRKHKHINS